MVAALLLLADGSVAKTPKDASQTLSNGEGGGLKKLS